VAGKTGRPLGTGALQLAVIVSESVLSDRRLRRRSRR